MDNWMPATFCEECKRAVKSLTSHAETCSHHPPKPVYQASEWPAALRDVGKEYERHVLHLTAHADSNDWARVYVARAAFVVRVRWLLADAVFICGNEDAGYEHGLKIADILLAKEPRI